MVFPVEANVVALIETIAVFHIVVVASATELVAPVATAVVALIGTTVFLHFDVVALAIDLVVHV